MSTKKELQAQIDALRAEVTALRALVFARGGGVQVIPGPASPYPYPYYPNMPAITFGTSTDNPAHPKYVGKAVA